MRYDQLLPIIEHNKPQTIVEVGTWNGLRAIMMATEALKHQDQVHYIGFDLFEDATPETDEREFNVKKPSKLIDVRKRLKEFADKNEGFSFKLVKGDTREKLKASKAPLRGTDIDLAFIDGGHSVETVAHDFAEISKKAKVIVCDDWYDEGVDTERFGCNKVIEGKEFVVLPEVDPVKGGGKVRMAVWPRQAWPGQMNIVIKTRNCVPDKHIQANIRYTMTLNPECWIKECRQHDETAVIVSGGPGFRDRLEDIRQRAEDPKQRIICVKHSHDDLIEAGIIPWACLLLDPRSHVKDFIENPHPDVIYFAASMCHPTTIDRLVDRGARIWGYHAHVGADEHEVIQKMAKALNGTEKPKDHIMLGGGSTAAVRGISVLHCLGFRTFKLYGFDSCYFGDVDRTTKLKTGMDKYMDVEIAGRKFVTDPELLAQAQDFEKMMEQKVEVDIECFGDGIVPHLWQVKRKILPTMKEVLDG